MRVQVSTHWLTNLMAMEYTSIPTSTAILLCFSLSRSLSRCVSFRVSHSVSLSRTVSLAVCFTFHLRSPIGSFCEFYGANGTIPDWRPHYYSPEQVSVPSFLPDTADVRADIAGMYTAWDRLDTGLGLIMQV